jgi:hypothetical protein
VAEMRIYFTLTITEGAFCIIPLEFLSDSLAYAQPSKVRQRVRAQETNDLG